MDMESGNIELFERYRKLKARFQHHQKRIFFVLSLFLVVTIAWNVQKGIEELEQAAEKNTGFTLTEEPHEYIDIDITKLQERSPNIKYKKFIPKTSSLNRKIQVMNIEKLYAKIKPLLDQEQWICIHLRNFGVDYDITMFRDGVNKTIIDPVIEQVSETYELIPEIGIDGMKKYAKRPTELRIRHVDKNMTYDNEILLSGNDAICFSHYQGITI